jgi:hypothetical protein
MQVVSTGNQASEREYHFVLRCPCGESLTGDTEDELVEASFDHLRARHPDLGDAYEREHILFMALRLPK